MTITRSTRELSLVLAPALGGAIAALTFRGQDILRPLPRPMPGLVPRANQAGSFPLVPYSNRIAHGRFRFDGVDYALAKNFGDHPHPLHGHGWHLAWMVEAQSARSITLACEHTPDGEQALHWPWPFLARQVFDLDDDRLRCTLLCTNLAPGDAPMGLGFHPYFARADRARLRFAAHKVQINGLDSLPTGLEDIPPAWNFREMRTPTPGSVDNCFTGWDGEAQIAWPDTGILAQIRSTGARNAVLFVPSAEKNFIAVEPVSHINNAINDLPLNAGPAAMRRLAPGETMSIDMTITVSSHADA